jgi:hypothetical protein
VVELERTVPTQAELDERLLVLRALHVRKVDLIRSETRGAVAALGAAAELALA